MEAAEVNAALPSAVVNRNDPAMPSAGSSWNTTAFVLGVWGLTLYAALAYVATYGAKVPYQDDWELVARLTGAEPVTLDWLWHAHNSHRIPLFRATMLGLYRVSNCDFRAGMFFFGMVLGATSLGLIWAARRIRGRTSYADAFFPLALFWGDYCNILWSWQVVFVLPLGLLGCLLVMIARSPARLTLGYAGTAGVCLILLVLCGPSGMAYVPPLALWFGYGAIRSLRAPEIRQRCFGVLLLTLILLALVLVGVNLFALESAPPEGIPPSPSLWASLKTGIQMLSMAFGLAVAPFWPITGRLILLLLLGGVAFLLLSWFRQPGQRVRVAGLALFLVGAGMLALGVGHGRAGLGDHAGLSGRYVTMAVPVLCGVFLILVGYDAPVSRLLQICLFTLFCLLVPLNMRRAVDHGRHMRSLVAPFERDLRAGKPPVVLADHHAFTVYGGAFLPDGTNEAQPKEAITIRLRMLREAGVGRFRRVAQDPAAFREVPFPAEPIATNQLVWKQLTPHTGVGQGQGPDPCLVFNLTKPQFVYAIRLKCTFEHPHTAPLFFQVFWKNADQQLSELERTRRSRLKAGNEERTITVWIHDTIDQFRIDPDWNPCVFRISEIVLLLPEPSEPGALAALATGRGATPR